jgi:hypothetical protein
MTTVRDWDDSIEADGQIRFFAPLAHALRGIWERRRPRSGGGRLVVCPFRKTGVRCCGTCAGARTGSENVGSTEGQRSGGVFARKPGARACERPRPPASAGKDHHPTPRRAVGPSDPAPWRRDPRMSPPHRIADASLLRARSNRRTTECPCLCLYRLATEPLRGWREHL